LKEEYGAENQTIYIIIINNDNNNSVCKKLGRQLDTYKGEINSPNWMLPFFFFFFFFIILEDDIER
jgi:hypothetical protein